MVELNEEHICIQHPHACMLYLMLSFILKLSYVNHIFQFQTLDWNHKIINLFYEFEIRHVQL
jgi:hypothetical protein